MKLNFPRLLAKVKKHKLALALGMLSASVLAIGSLADAANKLMLISDRISGEKQGSKTTELISILDRRAERIVRDLRSEGSRKFSNYAQEFSSLHVAHVQQLRQSNMTAAHELLREIHELSFKIWVESNTKPYVYAIQLLTYCMHEPQYVYGDLSETYIFGNLAVELFQGISDTEVADSEICNQNYSIATLPNIDRTYEDIIPLQSRLLP